MPTDLGPFLVDFLPSTPRILQRNGLHFFHFLGATDSRGLPLTARSATVLTRIHRKHAGPPARIEAVLPDDICDFLVTLPCDQTVRRVRAIFLSGFAEGLLRPAIMAFDPCKNERPDSGGWIEARGRDALLHPREKTDQREVQIAGAPAIKPAPFMP